MGKRRTCTWGAAASRAAGVAGRFALAVVLATWLVIGPVGVPARAAEVAPAAVAISAAGPAAVATPAVGTAAANPPAAPALAGPASPSAALAGAEWKPPAGFAGSEEELVVLRLFTDPSPPLAEMFTEGFLAAVPPAKISEIFATYRDKLGDYKRAQGKAGKYDLYFTRGKAPCKISLDARGQVEGLWFGMFQFLENSPKAVQEAFAKVPGQLGVAVVRDGKDLVFALEPDKPLAIGSSFKLYILKALADAVASGSRRRDEVVRLQPGWRSLPSGVFQAWPEGTAVTLDTLAVQMISISDNTATDHLLFALGREAVEAAAPPRMRPFLATAEMFKLKLGPTAAKHQAAYLAGDLAAQRAILATLASEPLPGLETAGGWKDPRQIDRLEWHASARELAEVILALRDQPALAVNPGLAVAEDWAKVAFKGGSEPGVLNYTHLLQKNIGSSTYCVVATVNDPAKPVDDMAFNEAVMRLMGLVEAGGL